MADTISIEGLDKAEVLCALYNRSRPQGMGFLQYTEDPLPIEEARSLLEKTTYFDYLKGRVMKVDLSQDEFDPWLYDRDNGSGAAGEAVLQLRASGETNPTSSQIAHEEQRRIAAQQVMDSAEKQSGFIGETGGIATFQLGLDPQVIPKAEDYLD